MSRGLGIFFRKARQERSIRRGDRALKGQSGRRRSKTQAVESAKAVRKRESNSKARKQDMAYGRGSVRGLVLTEAKGLGVTRICATGASMIRSEGRRPGSMSESTQELRLGDWGDVGEAKRASRGRPESIQGVRKVLKVNTSLNEGNKGRTGQSKGRARLKGKRKLRRSVIKVEMRVVVEVESKVASQTKVFSEFIVFLGISRPLGTAIVEVEK
ncbi:hypothetical protein BV22DRAFT_1043262 [Leucogyrophana mollusca]|uniref:Uncharacterized protein n=1 Tax=Leucogyrophana mollusca TaxID=85980 RepID=A0ACB8BYC2_9AGAM|nr:hypothetical protein BV22DRAFT_1043262 [Leucogyrophana mollusca]